MSKNINLTTLKPKEIRSIKAEIVELENMYKADQASGHPKIQDRAEFFKDVNKKKKLLADHSPVKLVGPKANRLYAEAKKLKEVISDAMPPANKFYQRSVKGTDNHKKKMNFEQAVKQQLAFQTNPRLQAAVSKFTNIMRSLDPENEEQLLEGLRRSR